MNESPALSVVITVVGGAECVHRCLTALQAQADPVPEIIVPYDAWAAEVAPLAHEFPQVRFHRIRDAGLAARPTISARTHRLYDRRRAVGLGLARGRIVAMIEDTMVPAADWCRQILAAHDQPYAAIGGAIQNGIDRPLQWALYYCDFGRYGLPLRAGAAPFVSDVNVSYKRDALEATRALWQDAYHETVVHWHLQAHGGVVYLDPRLVVTQHRPASSLTSACRERMEWGRVFAETRVATCTPYRRVLYALGTPLLPALLLLRILGHMGRQRRTARQIGRTVPLLVLLLSAWSVGELLGYVSGPPHGSLPPAATDLELEHP